jgi:hypothetical protein
MNSKSNHPLAHVWPSLLGEALHDVQGLLNTFAVDAEFASKIKLVFGDGADVVQAKFIVRELANSNSSVFPKCEIRDGSEINGARGAFASLTNTIYLSQQFINSASTQEIAAVLLEEIGHAIDCQLNALDTPGDEGELFSHLARGNGELGISLMQRIKKEDDTVVVTLGNQTLKLEQANAGANPAFDLIGLTRLRNDPQFAGIDGSGFTVAVLDTGLDASHPLIGPNFRAFVDFVDDIINPYDSSTHALMLQEQLGQKTKILEWHRMLG